MKDHGFIRLPTTSIWFFNTSIQGLGIFKPKGLYFNTKRSIFKQLVLLPLLKSKMPIDISSLEDGLIGHSTLWDPKSSFIDHILDPLSGCLELCSSSASSRCLALLFLIYYWSNFFCYCISIQNHFIYIYIYMYV